MTNRSVTWDTLNIILHEGSTTRNVSINRDGQTLAFTVPDADPPGLPAGSPTYAKRDGEHAAASAIQNVTTYEWIIPAERDELRINLGVRYLTHVIWLTAPGAPAELTLEAGGSAETPPGHQAPVPGLAAPVVLGIAIAIALTRRSHN